MSLSRSAILTPPSDKKIESTNSDKGTKEYFSHGNSSNIYLQSQAEDDVFSGDTRSIPESASGVSIVPIASTAPFASVAPVAGQEVIEFAANNTIAPRADRLTGPITPSNAQGVLAPRATIFVAKYVIDRRCDAQLTSLNSLPVHRTDDQLVVSCHESFDQFGTNSILVRRDRRGHPYALISYYVRVLDFH